MADNNAGNSTAAVLQTGRIHLQLMLEHDKREQFICLPIARVVEKRADKNLLLDDEFIPPCLNCRAKPRLHGYLE